MVFAPQPIDQHYPAAEDGPSWIELLHRYEPWSFAGDKVILHQRAVQPVITTLERKDPVEAKLGERVPVPAGAALRFASFDISPTPLGQAAMTLYKSEPLRLTVWMADGAERSYRLPRGMARAGFLLSPTTRTAAEFASLYGNPTAYRTPDRTVVSLRVGTTDMLWEQSYRVMLAPVAQPALQVGRR